MPGQQQEQDHPPRAQPAYKMSAELSSTTPLLPRGSPDAAALGPGASPRAGAGFAATLQAQRAGTTTGPRGGGEVEVRAGDTLSRLVRARLEALGRPAGPAEVYKGVQQVASANRLPDANRLQVGQTVDLSTLGARAAPVASVMRQVPQAPASLEGLPRTALAGVPAWEAQRPSVLPGVAAAALRPEPTPVLQATLERASRKGFIPREQVPQVQSRILGMARDYGFSPDDFARVVLMESDGLNPRASNGRCHGIIQFCEGPGKGADAVGLQGRAHTILDKGVLEQLDLVERYFQDAGLKRGAGGRVDLTDLYLTVLTPAAREQRQPHEPLAIAGVQARHLHEGADRERPITRSSIAEGLLRHARQTLESVGLAAGGKNVTPQRQTLAAGAAYQAVAMLVPTSYEEKPRAP